nr:GntR family transcriptional regulator [Propylenella binzhouense]
MRQGGPAERPAAAGGRERAARSLRDVAYEAVRHRIATLAFRPGEYLSEAYLSAILGIGRTPVHQALDRLALEGLVDVIPRKGVMVRPVDLREARQIIEVRLVNEIHCVRLAARRASEDEIRHLSDVLARADQWMATRKTEPMMLLDREFHAVLAAASRNAVLAECLGKLHERSLRLWFISLDTAGHHVRVQEQHRAILEAVRRRDADAAEAAMRSHIEAFQANVTTYV